MASTLLHLIRLRPRHETTYISRNRTVWITSFDGLITDKTQHGLFVHQTRLLSRYRYLIDGAPPQSVAHSAVEQHSWLGYYIFSPQSEDGAAERSVELRVSRFVDDGCHEDLDLVNYTGRPVSFDLTVEMDADFADQQAISGPRKQTGKLRRRWHGQAGGPEELVFDYRATHAYDHQGEKGTASIHRALTVRIERATTPPAYKARKLTFAVELAPGGSWHACLSFIPFIDDRTLPLPCGCRSFFQTANDYDRKRDLFLQESTHFTATGQQPLTSVVLATLEQAKHDLAALRLYDYDQGDRAWTVAAGLPVYTALFGRDPLITGWQAALVSPEPMLGILDQLPRSQAQDTNDWRDAQPGRMIHQMQDDPLAALNYTPFGRYYGSLSAPVFYPELVFALWLWTGDEARVRRYLTPAFKALRWMDDYADPKHNGVYAYKTRSEKGLAHQFWKDSGQSVVYEDGSQVPDPVATCEMQALVYMAKDHLAAVLDWLDDTDTAQRLRAEAAEVKKRFNDLFWMEDEQYVAMGLDPDGRQIRTIASDPGACLAAGAVDESRARAVADRLLAPELFSGWGVRTLSALHPAFDPFSYQRGSVWPVENGIVALALVRYGLHEHVQRLARAQFEAAALFHYNRLPEVFSGHARDAAHPFPAVYPKANWPQAWSAAAVFSFVQALLGLFPCAPLESLIVDPHLPEWLPEITLENLHLGQAQITIRFERRSDGASTYHVVDARGPIHVYRQPSPWSLTAGPKERFKDLLVSLLPGK